MVSIGGLFSIKYAALATLVLQNTLLVVFMRYSRIVSGPIYYSSTAVATMELLKFLTCLLVIAYQRGPLSLWNELRDEVFSRPLEVIRLSVPSLLYTIQNNLLYYALSHLDAATYSVCYQMKILTTAVFSVILLQRKLSMLQWLSLVILTAGVAMTQLSAQKTSESHENTMAGFFAVMCAAGLSGFAGVYFEKVLKGSSTSLWMRNIQMSASSLVLGLCGVYFSGDLEGVMKNGFFYGYTSLVWSVIALQAIGGLVVAVVVKYADNILKGFAASFSLLTSCLLCILLFDFVPTPLFITGALFVNIAMYMYSYSPTLPSTTEREREREREKEMEGSTKGDLSLSLSLLNKKGPLEKV